MLSYHCTLDAIFTAFLLPFSLHSHSHFYCIRRSRLHLEDRYGKKSVIVTSQLPVAKWYEFIGEPTMADAIMDRLAGNAHKIDLKGESLRKNTHRQSS